MSASISLYVGTPLTKILATQSLLALFKRMGVSDFVKKFVHEKVAKNVPILQNKYACAVGNFCLSWAMHYCMRGIVREGFSFSQKTFTHLPVPAGVSIIPLTNVTPTQTRNLFPKKHHLWKEPSKKQTRLLKPASSVRYGLAR